MIPQEMHIKHPGLLESIKELEDELGDEMSEPTKNYLVKIFSAGWSACVNKTMRPAVNLSMILLKMFEVGKQADKPILLSPQVAEQLHALCTQVIGDIQPWQLDEIVEVEHVDPKKS